MTTDPSTTLEETSPVETTPEEQYHPPKLTPRALLDQLQTYPGSSVQALTRHFHCSLQQLSAALADPEFLLHFKLQSQITFIHSRLFAQNQVCAALDKTASIMRRSEKPEVIRRAAASLIQAAGLTILTRPQNAPPSFPESAADITQDPQFIALASSAQNDFLTQLADHTTAPPTVPQTEPDA